MKKSHWYAIAAAVIAAVLLACGTGDGGGNGAEGVPEDEAEPSDVGRDGQFEFTVNDMECGVAEIGDEFTSETAQGEFCLVTITVENIGDEPSTLDVTSQLALDAEGQEYNADDSLAAAIEYDEVWYNNINPGNSVEGTLLYDVPEGTELTELQLHDSPFSNGVRVLIP